MQREQLSGQFGIEITGGADLHEMENRGVPFTFGAETSPTAILTLEDTISRDEQPQVTPAVPPQSEETEFETTYREFEANPPLIIFPPTAPTTLLEPDEVPNEQHSLLLPDVDFTVTAHLSHLDQQLGPFQFQNSQYYFIDDPVRASTFFDEVLAGSIPTGLEFGAGYTPTYLFKIEEEMPLWIAADPLQSAFVTRKNLIPIINSQGNVSERRIVYIPQRISHEDVNALDTPISTYVYRNPDHSSPLPMPRLEFLEQAGKRFVLIADSYHGDEWPVYKGLLRERGFDGDMFISTDESFSYTPDIEQPLTHIFDSAGILNSQAD